MALIGAQGRTSFAQAVVEPEATPAASALPEIGRTRATRATCAVLRDLVEPSIAAAHRADKRFEESRPLLASYVKKVDEKDPVRAFLLHRIESAYLAMVDQRLAISKALGDPRIDAAVTDPELVALRRALQTLEDGQIAQVNTLGIWTMKARIDYGRGTLGADDRPLYKRDGPFAGGDPNPLYSPPDPSDLKGTLTLTGDGATDARRVTAFTGDVAAFNANHEAAAVRTVVAATAGCAKAASP
jgi:hypothetical protein